MSYSYEAIDKKEWREITHEGYTWVYLIVGDSEEILIMFPGGLRRPVYGGSFIKELSKNFKVLIPVYPQISDMRLLSDGYSQMMRNENINSAHLFGSSFGGLMTQAFMYYYPEKVKKAVIGNSGTVIEGKSFEKRISRSLLLIKILPAFIVRWVIRRAFTKLVPVGIKGREEIVSAIQNVIKSRQLDKKDIICHFESLLFFQNDLGLTSDFALSIQDRILIITAEKDRGVTSEARDSLQKMYPKAQFHHFVEGGHMPMLVNPTEYVNKVKEFLLE
jgi:pimeloyl-ACP methyl ester carboxylesterase